METITNWLSKVATIDNGTFMVEIVLFLCAVYLVWYIMKHFGIAEDLYHYFICNDYKDEDDD